MRLSPRVRYSFFLISVVVLILIGMSIPDHFRVVRMPASDTAMSSEATRASVVSNQLGEIATNLSQIATLVESQANVQADLATNQTASQGAQDQLTSNLASLVGAVGTVNTNLIEIGNSLATLTANQTAVQAQVDALTATGTALMTVTTGLARSFESGRIPRLEKFDGKVSSMPNWISSSRARFAQFHDDALAILDNIARTFQADAVTQIAVLDANGYRQPVIGAADLALAKIYAAP